MTQVNAALVPDFIEKEVYVTVTRFIVKLLTHILDQLHVSVMGVDAQIKLVPAASS